jgi:transposase
MAAPRLEIEVVFTEQELTDLARVSRSRMEPASRVERARILLAYRQTPSLYATGRAIGVTHQTVERCLRRAQDLGVMAALDDSPRPGRQPTITSEARTFIVDLACRKPKELGYPHELWTTRLLTKHVRDQGPAVGHACLANLAQGTLCKILAAHEVKPHKVRYYLQRRDPEFAEKMAELLCVYREVSLLKQAAQTQDAAEKQDEEPPAVAIISYDEKPGIQALATTAPDLPPQPMRHPTLARDHEYVRLGTLSLLAGIDLSTGVVHASVEERHRSREFVEFLKRLDAAYAPATAIKIILDNHSAHISKETKAWLAEQPEGRFTFVFTPKHGSWLNLVEGFFSKLARSALRHIRVASLEELRQRILAAIEQVNREPVIHKWTYKINQPA